MKARPQNNQYEQSKEKVTTGGWMTYTCSPATSPTKSSSFSDYEIFSPKNSPKKRPFPFCSTQSSPPKSIPQIEKNKLTQSGNTLLYGSISPYSEIKVMESCVLGQGKFGTVKVAVIEKNGDKIGCAIKIVKSSYVPGDMKILNRFFNYIQEKELNNFILIPFITVQDYEAKLIYQVMPLGNFGDGDKLIEALAQLDKEEKELVKRHVIFSLIKVNQTMTQHRIKHLDLKPANIILNDKGHCYVSDFDFSIILNEDGTIFHQSNYITGDEKLLPYNLGSVDTTDENREAKFSWVDAYRLGVTCLLIYCEIPKEEYESKRLNLRNIDPQWLNALFEKNDVPLDIREIILSLLNSNLTNGKDAICFAWKNAQEWCLDQEKIQHIFTEWCKQSDENLFTCTMQELKETFEESDSLRLSSKIINFLASSLEAKPHAGIKDNYHDESQQSMDRSVENSALFTPKKPKNPNPTKKRKLMPKSFFTEAVADEKRMGKQEADDIDPDHKKENPLKMTRGKMW